MTRHHDRYGVGRTSRPDGANGVGRTRESGQRAVAGGSAIADVDGQVTEDNPAESFGQLPIQRNVEGVTAAGEVLVELTRDGIEAGRGVQQPGADPVGKALEDGVVAFVAEGH